MRMSAWHLIRFSTAFLLMVILATTTNSWAQTHVVSPAELQKAVADASDARARDQATLNGFLTSSQASKALESTHMNAAQVKTAISTLDDQELHQLASRADQANADFAAGRLSDRDLIWIIVAIAALILIIVAVR